MCLLGTLVAADVEPRLLPGDLGHLELSPACTRTRSPACEAEVGRELPISVRGWKRQPLIVAAKL